jgi:hypothetical protein
MRPQLQYSMPIYQVPLQHLAVAVVLLKILAILVNVASLKYPPKLA